LYIGIYFQIDSFAQDELDDRYIRDQSISLIIDQDAFSPYNEDRNYTMGFSLGYSGRYADRNYLVFPWFRKGADWLFGLRGLHASGQEFLPGLSFMVGAFTPENLVPSEPVTDDRPYSSIIAISSSRSSLFNGSQDEIKQSALTTRLNVGVLGTSIASNVQTYIHDQMWFGSTRPIPEGWGNQISNGGEPTLLYQIQFTKPAFIAYANEGMDRKMVELMYQVETNLGYYTNMAGGAVIRIGRYNTPFWYMNNSGMSGVNQAPNLIAESFEFFFMFALRGRAVLYNGLLQGQFRESNHTLSRSQINPLILESELGLVMRYKNVSLLYYPFQLRTAEFNLPTSRTHIWGSMALFVSW